jgi:subtilisin family serine protease
MQGKRVGSVLIRREIFKSIFFKLSIMCQREKKFRMKKRYISLMMIFLAVFCFSEIASSQIKNINEKEEVAKVQENERSVKKTSPVKVAIVDADFLGAETLTKGGGWHIYDVASNSEDELMAGSMMDKKKLAENEKHGTAVVKEFLTEYANLQTNYAPNILLVRVATEKDVDGKVSSAKIAQGIKYATQNGAQIINLSLGTLQKNSNVEEAISYANSKGVLIVAASGNWGEEAEIGKGKMSSYAQNEKVIAVGAMNAEREITSYTSGLGNDKLEFLAQPKFGTGTSLAAPIVTAAIASILQEKEGEQMDIEKIRDLLHNQIEKKIISIRRL